ncbi:MAG: hypothetical protein ACRBN8_30035 [Nannocystales bacterium]
MLLLLAAGLAYWVFKDDIDPNASQYQILRVSFSLAAGFGAGAFAGGMTVQSKGLRTGYRVTAVGGFAVFLIVYWGWQPPVVTPTSSLRLLFVDEEANPVNVTGKASILYGSEEFACDTLSAKQSCRIGGIPNGVVDGDIRVSVELEEYTAAAPKYGLEDHQVTVELRRKSTGSEDQPETPYPAESDGPLPPEDQKSTFLLQFKTGAESVSLTGLARMTLNDTHYDCALKEKSQCEIVTVRPFSGADTPAFELTSETHKITTWSYAKSEPPAQYVFHLQIEAIKAAVVTKKKTVPPPKPSECTGNPCGAGTARCLLTFDSEGKRGASGETHCAALGAKKSASFKDCFFQC